MLCRNQITMHQMTSAPHVNEDVYCSVQSFAVSVDTTFILFSGVFFLTWLGNGVNVVNFNRWLFFLHSTTFKCLD